MKRSSWLSIWFLGLLIPISCFGCAKQEIRKDVSPDAYNVPAWLKEVPQSQNKICAVGQCGPTYFPDASRRRAEDDARGKLAISLSAHIESIMLLIHEADGSQVKTASAVEATTFSSDYVLQYSEIVSVWVDELGIFSGSEKGYTYALACTDKKSAENSFSTIQKQTTEQK